MFIVWMIGTVLSLTIIYGLLRMLYVNGDENKNAQGGS